VLWHHGRPASELTLLGRGFLGVELFFVLSGFLIVLLLLRERSSNRAGAVSLGRFYVRRAFRILPPFYLLLAGLTLVGLVAHRSNNGAFFRGLPWQLANLTNWSTTDPQSLSMSWSLSTEAQFYVVMPLLLVITPHRFFGWVLGAFAAVNVLLWTDLPGAAFSRIYGTRRPDLEILDTTYMGLVLGAALAYSLTNERTFNRISNIVTIKAAGLAIPAAMLATAAWAPLARGGVWRLAFQLLTTLWVARLVIGPRTDAIGLLDNKITRRIGTVSYSLYLYHLVIFGYVFKAAAKLGITTRIVAFPVACAASYITAECSYRFFELPLAAYRDKRGDRRRRTPPEVIAAPLVSTTPAVRSL
jgi:peptidoglycan/LPS O-acetylase OafA/YrhL